MHTYTDITSGTTKGEEWEGIECILAHIQTHPNMSVMIAISLNAALKPCTQADNR